MISCNSGWVEYSDDESEHDSSNLATKELLSFTKIDEDDDGFIEIGSKHHKPFKGYKNQGEAEGDNRKHPFMSQPS